MKKNSFLHIQTFALLIALTFFLASCKHEPQLPKLNFKARLTTWYRVSPTAPSPVVVNGVTYVSLANLVVSGEGTATSIGNVNSYANTLSFGASLEAPPSGAIGAPVIDIPGYPFLGGPLPLIQTGDFAALPAIITAFHIPKIVLGNTINQVLYNKKGDALFLSNIPGTGTSTLISSTEGGYTDKTVILGGAGKFIHAQGELNNTGRFSFIAPYDGEDDYEGWIIY
jgi:hypothetical protein